MIVYLALWFSHLFLCDMVEADALCLRLRRLVLSHRMDWHHLLVCLVFLLTSLRQLSRWTGGLFTPSYLCIVVFDCFVPLHSSHTHTHPHAFSGERLTVVPGAIDCLSRLTSLDLSCVCVSVNIAVLLPFTSHRRRRSLFLSSLIFCACFFLFLLRVQLQSASVPS